ncbi:sensor histidine kinase [Algoriphagus sediminis]|uniref:histidine kinase n=1 Tax=Algoriphagus sediminis TaxID=3057113 RepID=A0ABT7YD04_9BACT|nr:ATP-binding protein [Algoriphagus sediminis]MDN3204089.1 ATP-binding protein [Algoriphagus sediminis]
MGLDAFIILFIIIFLRRDLDKSPESQFWRTRFNYGMALIIFLGVMSEAKLGITLLWDLGIMAVYAIVAYTIYMVDQFRHKKYFIVCWTPTLILSFLVGIVESFFPSFATAWEDVIAAILIFSLIWGIGLWLFGRRQRKALEQERKIAEEKEKEYQITQEIRASLEMEVSDRTKALVKQKEELQKALEELKATQDQLVHSEKMASLGELTAGIAHEIQNPLNFVNNFSEVSNELIAEIQEEFAKSKDDQDPELIKEIFTDLAQNLSKIQTHGKRADSIVKGMLQHSRNSGDEKELTDINLLADEYLRLSYHGLRAKDKSFNAEFELNLEEGLPEMKVVPQDIGRVFLNLINNAFYAVNEKSKKEDSSNYKPLVTVSTKKRSGGIEISVNDNGDGIPKDIVNKIFQPFFTTKPTGSGTGLGLSMSYDIITKGHGGTLKVKSNEGKGTTFTITLNEEN